MKNAVATSGSFQITIVVSKVHQSLFVDIKMILTVSFPPHIKTTELGSGLLRKKLSTEFKCSQSMIKFLNVYASLFRQFAMKQCL